ncbi:hypothetical protein Pla123a_37080 [Posidoniimonas polymericola]|uniref:DUF5009 domain-containing protein n=1 Tax=Posidoniimonas polymericola TaxID=2528002 RepID=A0A5C5YFG4_9BACT|nr:hypothetical protein [Posidoniimonas polymericola]TWT73814.1 hypothetical protein Pla123a_37080 [Posidoniimonas polymericola]
MADPTAEPAKSPRLGSIDAFRGLAMLLMVAEVLHLCGVAEHFPESRLWAWLCHHQSHVPWVGLSVHDMIQPAFTFLVGVSLPFSIASRRRRGQSMAVLAVHAFYRAAVLVLLGIWLRSIGRGQTYFTFEDTLTQIGLGYGFLFLIALRPRRQQWAAVVVILLVSWAAFALYPAPPADFDYASVGVPTDWPHLLSGFESHWNKNTNLSAAFDRWFLNLLPREEPFVDNEGGYQTLSFVPTLTTMVLGLLAGGLLAERTAAKENSTGALLGRLAVLGAVCLAVGYATHYAGVCPLVKRIWTPSFVLVSGGWCFLLLAALYWLIDIRGWRGWAWPLTVIGMNSIAIYVIANTMHGLVDDMLRTHLGRDYDALFGEPYRTLVSGGLVMLAYWLVLLWMHRRRLYLKV